MRLRNRHTLFVVALVLAALFIASTALEVSAAGPGRGWRSTRYGRKGTEIWLEFPRMTFPTGKGYKGDYDIETGQGFGFGLMWGVSDNLAVEGRMVQTNHLMSGDKDATGWDIDGIRIGPRYTFFERYRFQPFLGAGWAKITLERDTGSSALDSFERLSGYGAYVTIGVDYIHNSAWSAFFRADYTHGGYGHITEGLEEGKLDDPISGNCVSIALGVAYRVPIW